MYYEGYEIDCKGFYLLDYKERKVLDACIWMVDNRATIRETARNCGYSPSTLWRRIHKECRYLSTELYDRVCHQIKENKSKYGR